ncbi:hypothetical protein HJFPF1_05822 [Paramyrothecium foliicola]|nr:hypothetical protein HJFPF1_05822 [Paramyrothecium foliicola]
MAPVTSDHELIRNCIARYCVGVDAKDWDIFSSAFLPNVKATMPGLDDNIEGITALKATVQGMVGSFQTHHALTTQMIQLTGENTASATTYCRTDVFGMGKDEGKTLTNWGMYQDKLVKSSCDGREDWKIAERTATFTAPLRGDLGLIGM